jgi:hypothetical protein
MRWPLHIRRGPPQQGAANGPQECDRLGGAIDFVNTEGSPQKQLTARLYPDRRGERFDVIFDGEVIVRRSRCPELDLARALLAHGIVGTVRVLDGNADRPRPRTIFNIEKAAALTVEEGPNGPRFVKRKQSRVDRPPTAETRMAGNRHLSGGCAVHHCNQRRCHRRAVGERDDEQLARSRARRPHVTAGDISD